MNGDLNIVEQLWRDVEGCPSSVSGGNLQMRGEPKQENYFQEDFHKSVLPN